MCCIRDCDFEGVAFQDFGIRENGRIVYQPVCKYHKEE
jgi:hypothetical protein